MLGKKKRFSVSMKINVFLIIITFTVSFGVALVAYVFNVIQIDNYFKRLSENSARNFVSSVDPEFLGKLREVAESKEFQELREKAEKARMKH